MLYIYIHIYIAYICTICHGAHILQLWPTIFVASQWEKGDGGAEWSDFPYAAAPAPPFGFGPFG